MRFRDALKFSLELILPEKAVLAVERLAVERTAVEPLAAEPVGPERSAESAPAWHEPSAPTTEETEARNDARRIIEELDSGQFGGPSFGPQSISLMASALEQALASLRPPMTDERSRAIAAAILKVAESGERDPVRLRTRAMSALEQEGAQAAEVPSDPPQAVSGPHLG
jgi:hypothetical protein